MEWGESIKFGVQQFYDMLIIVDLRGTFNKFPDFFVQACKIVVDTWKFSMLLLYILWDDWPIFLWFQLQMNSYSSNSNTPY